MYDLKLHESQFENILNACTMTAFYYGLKACSTESADEKAVFSRLEEYFRSLGAEIERKAVFA